MSEEGRKTFKSIFVFCDGTGNDLLTTNCPTNINLMYNFMKIDENSFDKDGSRIALYYEGIGVDEYKDQENSLIDGIAAKSLDYKIKQAYSGIMANYFVGDKVYIFGFSRGSLVARSLSNFLCRHGILKKEAGFGLINKEFYSYKRINERRALNIAEKGDENAARWKGDSRFQQPESLQIEFMGLFDTVPGLDMFDLIHHDLRFDPAYHLRFCHLMANDVTKQYRNLSFAIDDTTPQTGCCGPKSPTCCLNKHDSICADINSGIDNKFCEVRFPGDHCCVGGGWTTNPFKETCLSNDSLRFMMIKCNKDFFWCFDDKREVLIAPQVKHFSRKWHETKLVARNRLEKEQLALEEKLQSDALCPFPNTLDDRKAHIKSILHFKNMVFGPLSFIKWAVYTIISPSVPLTKMKDKNPFLHPALREVERMDADFATSLSLELPDKSETTTSASDNNVVAVNAV